MNKATIPLILSLGLLTACGSTPPGPGTPSNAAPLVVQTLSVAPAGWPSTYEATGTVRARTAAVISSKVMGYVREVRFQAGDRVQAGQVLVELDSRDTDTQVQQAVAVQREAEEALQESERRYRSFVQNFQGIIYQGRLDFVPVFFHGAVEEITGYREDEFTAGRPRWDQIIYPDDVAAIYETVKKLGTVPGFATEREYRIVHRNGQVRWVHELIQNVCDDSGKPALVQGALYDVTERKRMEEDLSKYREGLEERVLARTTELTQTNKQLREEIKRRKGLERELLSVVEQERQRIGQELHDSIGQQLTGIAFMMEVLGAKLADKSLAEEAPYAEKINARVSRAVELARNLAKGLHPIDLDKKGLVAVLQELAADTEQLFDVSCTFTSDEAVPETRISAPINLYRIAQEAITNAVKHGKAKNIRVRLSSRNGSVVLSVENDGLDFPAEPGRVEGMGLKIMRYRAELMNSSLAVCKGARGGTIVTCMLPKEANP